MRSTSRCRRRCAPCGKRSVANDDVRAVILTGAGDLAFCSGIDRAESIENDYLVDEDRRRKLRHPTGPASSPFQYNDPGVSINPKENDLWKPVISAVNGMACGGALYLLGESDIIIAAEHATFFDPHVTYGMVAGFESMHLLQKLPFGETMRLVLMGAHERMSAERAYQMGLVSEVVPLSELMERAMWVARAIASAPPIAIQGTLRAVWMSHELCASRRPLSGVLVRDHGHPVREHRRGPGDISRAAPRVAASLRS